MRLKSFIQFLSVSLLTVAVLSIVSCGGCNQAAEEASPAQDPVETTPTVPPPPPVVRKRAEVKKREKPETRDEFVAIEDDEVETIDNVKFVPHRFTYTELEEEDKPLALSMKAFDDPPIYGKHCLNKEDKDECSQAEIERYLTENMNFPDEAEEMDGPTEYVSFLIQADGKIDKDNIQVLKQDPQCRSCAAEALTLIREMPKWQPAMKGGTPVAVRVTLPVRFLVR